LPLVGPAPPSKEQDGSPSTVVVCKETDPSVLYQWRINDGQIEVRALNDKVASHAEVRASFLRFNYRQRPGESYHQFMQRESDICAALILTESEDEAAERSKRVEEQNTQPVPKRGGPEVYLWQQEHDADIRRLVHHQDVVQLWLRTQPAQRIYNAH
jgi:hypothetical protein